MTDTFSLNAQNTNPIHSGLLSKMNGKSVKHEQFSVRLLKKEDVSSMFSLAQEIYNTLGAEEQTFIRKHENASYFENAVKDPTMAFIGVFHQNKLIAMSYIKICKNREIFNDEIPNQDTNAFKNNQKVATFGGDCVLPTYRGNRLNQCMVSIRLKLAERLKCREVYSIIDRNNVNNLTPYFANNFKLIAAGIDPSDNGLIYTMRSFLNHQKHLIYTPKTTRLFVPINNKGAIENLIFQGYQGICYHPKNKSLEFTTSTQPIQIRKNIITRVSQQRKVLTYV